ncbi:hypothetical protein ACFE04_002096 [Oxalis oulophora]
MFIMLSLNNQGGVIDRKLDVVETCKLQSRFIKKKVTVFHLEISKKWSHEDLKRVRWMLNSENKRGVLESDEIEDIESLQYDLSTIKTATNNFSDANKLGQGGFGIVYKGMLSSGQLIDVKRFLSNATHGDREFKNEVSLVARLQHRNLVRLLGFCLELGERLLIFEFVPKSSLDHYIFGIYHYSLCLGELLIIRTKEKHVISQCFN